MFANCPPYTTSLIPTQHMKPTIAVVIPNRNDAVPLMTCLNSLLDQKIQPDQIIIVDDQSTDNSVAIIEDHINNIPSAELILNPTNLGTMATLNVGLSRSTCDYVLFLSSNDYLEKGIFNQAKKSIANDGFPGVWSALVWAVDADGSHQRLYPSPVISLKDTFLSPDKCIRLAMSSGHWFTGTTLIYHRQTLQKIGGFEPAYHGLADLFAALTIASLKGASFSPKPYGVMRQHPGGLMWQTITNLPLLDEILGRSSEEGAKISAKLFNPKFCELMQRRIRFTAIRAYPDTSWLAHVHLWKGKRYRLLKILSPPLKPFKSVQLFIAFLLLRPLSDTAYIIWYRLIGATYIKIRRQLQS